MELREVLYDASFESSLISSCMSAILSSATRAAGLVMVLELPCSIDTSSAAVSDRLFFMFTASRLAGLISIALFNIFAFASKSAGVAIEVFPACAT